jgi:hypothetical protein
LTRIHDDASERVLEVPQRAAPTAAEPIAAGHLLTGLPTAPDVRGLGDAGRRGVLSLQRTAGNSAVASLFAAGRAVQREGEGEIPPNPFDEPSAPTGGGPITSDGGTTTINGGAIVLNAGMTSTGGVIRASTIIADSVVASSYTPGAGNVW